MSVLCGAALELLRALLRKLPENRKLARDAARRATAGAAGGRGSIVAAYLDAARPPATLEALRARSALAGVLAELVADGAGQRPGNPTLGRMWAVSSKSASEIVLRRP